MQINTPIRVTGTIIEKIIGNACYFNIVPHTYESIIVDKDIRQSKQEQAALRMTESILGKCISESNQKYINTNPVPSWIKKIAIVGPHNSEPSEPSIVGKHNKTSIYDDILGEFHENIEIKQIHVRVTDPCDVAKGIGQANKEGCDILVVTCGGMDTTAFSDPAVLQALLETKAYRILAVGHAQCVPLAYAFCDARAQTPTAAGQILSEIVKTNKKEYAINQQPMSMEKEQSQNKPNILQWFVSGIILGIIGDYLAGKYGIKFM